MPQYLIWLKILILPAVVWGVAKSDIHPHSNPKCAKSLSSSSHSFPPPVKFHVSDKTWLEKLVAGKSTKIISAVTVMQNTDAVDPKHIESVSDLLKHSRKNPDLLNLDVAAFLYNFFIQSMNKNLSESDRKKFIYDPQTARNLLEVLLIAHQHKPAEHPHILNLAAEILEFPTRVRFVGNPSPFAYLPLINTIVQFLKNDVDQSPKLLTLFRQLLTQMEDFYITSPSAYMNQPLFMEKAVESIVASVANLVEKDVRIMDELFERLSMLYKLTHPVRSNHAQIEYRHATMEAVMRELKPHHIPRLIINNPHIHEALILFFTKYFHHPAEKILNEIENFLSLAESAAIQSTAIQILAARELAGETTPYTSLHLEGQAKWVQPARTAPSWLTQTAFKKIKELSLHASDPKVRGLAQQVVTFVENQKVQD